MNALYHRINVKFTDWLKANDLADKDSFSITTS